MGRNFCIERCCAIVYAARHSIWRWRENLSFLSANLTVRQQWPLLVFESTQYKSVFWSQYQYESIINGKFRIGNKSNWIQIIYENYLNLIRIEGNSVLASGITSSKSLYQQHRSHNECGVQKIADNTQSNSACTRERER